MDNTSPDDRDSAAGARPDGLAGFVEELARSLDGIAHRLRTRRFEQLVDDARQLARERPELFVAGSVAVGFGVARLLRADSAPDGRMARPTDQTAGERPWAGGPASRDDADEALHV